MFMFTRLILSALSLSAVMQLATGSPVIIPRNVGSFGSLYGPPVLFGRRIVARPTYVFFARTTHPVIMKRGCRHGSKDSKRSLQSRHRDGYNSSDSKDDEDDDEKYSHGDKKKNEDSYDKCSEDEDDSSSSKKSAGLPGLDSLGKGGGAGGATNMLSGAGSPTKMLSGGGGGPTSMLSGEGGPTKMLSGGGGGPTSMLSGAASPTKMLGGGGGGLPGLGSRSLEA
ncbi:hypothetical protein PTTG_04053 [Puccinia triticina 1-1 BBBD Race 1]|uniref:Uncharacterized protein n=1 Tax=Puccinia triticina (isolate 1-1 / race 1 (BBBD)) TaxID=630390 RepID=A0A180G561_PUCT1|nr:hypothetical protein PTTG_04053 [Puccinia triticina 1-1 BBBD Race 1]